MIKACQDYQWNQTNGVTERAVRRVKEGTTTNAKWTTRRVVGLCDGNAIVTCAPCTTKWPTARRHPRKDLAKNVTDLRHIVEYIPITAKDRSRIHQFGQKTLKGVCFGSVREEVSQVT